jgi:prophage regulatory protein
MIRSSFSGPRLVRLAEVLERTGLSRTTIWRLERSSKFPRRRRLGLRAVGWLSSEIEEWVLGRWTSGSKVLPQTAQRASFPAGVERLKANSWRPSS